MVNRFEQYLLNTAAEGVAFVKRLESPNAKVLLDTFHMNIEEDDLVKAILDTGDLLGHFHVGERNRMPPGSTHSLPWEDMAAALKQINYQGASSWSPSSSWAAPSPMISRSGGTWSPAPMRQFWTKWRAMPAAS